MLCAALPPDALIPALASLGEPLSAQLADLRSAIVRAACDTLRELATVYGPALALGSMPLIVAVLPQLLSNLALLKAFSTVSVSAASVLIGLAPCATALKVLISHTKAAQWQARQGAYELMSILLLAGKEDGGTGGAAASLPSSLPTFRVSLKGLEAVLAAVARGLNDPDGAARSAAARAYWAALDAGHDMKVLDAWLSSLAAKEQKLIQRSRVTKR
jgi:hypothetical protein